MNKADILVLIISSFVLHAFMTGNADILRLLLQHRLEEEDEDFDDEDDQEENNTRYNSTNLLQF